MNYIKLTALSKLYLHCEQVVLDLIEYRQNLTVTNYSLSSPWIYADLVQLIHGGDFSGESTGDWHELMCHGITASVVQVVIVINAELVNRLITLKVRSNATANELFQIARLKA